MTGQRDIRFTSPICTPRTVASLVSMPLSTVYSWTKPTHTRPSVVHRLPADRVGWPSIPLAGLAEASALRSLRESGLPMRELVRAAEFIREKAGDEFALASPHLVTDGSYAYWEQSDELTRIYDRQGAFVEVLREHLRPLVIGDDGYVAAFRVEEIPGVLIDPRFNSGRMSFEDSRTPVFVVAAALRAGESRVEVAEQYGLPTEQVAGVESHLEWLAPAA